jgi:hypothetical protein
MPKRASITTKEFLVNAALPEQTDTYTVISHGFIIDKAMEKLAENGFTVEKELYRCNGDANIASGIYHLKYGNDMEMGMMFAWSNSYDKSMRFKCAIGGYVFANQAGMISGDMGTWGRKHTGTADQETVETIIHQISNAEMYYSQLVADKEKMKGVTLDLKKFSQILGRLYFEHGLLTGEQLGIIKEQYKRPSFDYKVSKDNLWQLYCHIIFALKKAHPRTWLDQQRLIHWFLCQELGIAAYENVPASPEVLQPVKGDPKQIDLVDSIAEVEAEQNGNPGITN